MERCRIIENQEPNPIPFVHLNRRPLVCKWSFGSYTQVVFLFPLQRGCVRAGLYSDHTQLSMYWLGKYIAMYVHPVWMHKL